MADTISNPNVPACFFFSNHVHKDVTGYEVCREIEKVVGPGKVVGAQFLHGLCRIYLSSLDARDSLLIKGVTIRGIYISIIGQNPNIVHGAGEKPAIKVIIGNLPMSISNDLILSSLKQVEGASVRTRIFDEKYRDESGGLSAFKTGRRFVYVNPPDNPLPRDFTVGEWRASLYHYGQKKKQVQQDTLNNKNTSDSSQVDNTQQEAQLNNTQQHSQPSPTQTCSAADKTESVGGQPSAQKDKNKGNTNLNQSKIDSFIPRRQGRPLERGRNLHNTSRSRSNTSNTSRKRLPSTDNSESQAVKSRSRLTSMNGESEPVDYFYYDNSEDSQGTRV